MSRTSTLVLRLLMVLVALCYSTILGWVYTTYVSPIFAYQGMFTQPISTFFLVMQIALATLPALLLPVELERPSEFQVILLYTIAYVPSVMIGYHICEPAKWSGYTVFLVLIATSLVLLAQVRRLAPLRVPVWAGGTWSRLLAALVFTAVTYSSVVYFYGLPDSVFDVAEIYGARADFKDRAAQVPSIINYLYWWQGIVVNPLIIIAGMLRGNLVLFALGVALEALLFSLTTLRGMLLTVAFCIFVVVFLRTSLRAKGLGFVLLLTIGMSSSAALMESDGIISVATRIFVQRWLAIQGQLSGAYFDFFVDNDKAYLGNSLLQRWVFYRYGELSPGEVIGDAYVSFGQGTIANATANFWADAFGQFGYSGIAFATAVAFVLLWIVDSVFCRYPRGVAVMLFSTCALSLTEQGVQMLLLTGGLLPLLLIGISAQRFFTPKTHHAKTYRSLDVRSRLEGRPDLP